MAVIYTISHPFTNEVVYVGVSRSLSKRIAGHMNNKNNTEISKWIQDLVSNFTIPKIEVIENCDSDETSFLETYWINQLTVWGFNLLNKNNNLFKPKKFTKTVDKNTGKVKIINNTKLRKSKKWTIDDLELGKVHKFLKKKRDVYVIYFRNRCIRYNLHERYLSIIEEGEYLIGTVIDKSEIKYSYTHISKSGRKYYYTPSNKEPLPRRSVGKKVTYGLDKINIGDTLTITPDKIDSFSISVKSFNKKHGKNLKYQYLLSEDNLSLTIQFIPNRDTPRNTPIPLSLRRPFKKRPKKLLSDIQVKEILESTLSVRMLALKYDVSEPTIYNTKKKFNPLIKSITNGK